jgi:hypothetical protein
MTKMKNLNQALLLMDLVVNKNRTVDQLTHRRPFAGGASHVTEPAEQIDAIEQSLAKTGSGIAVVLGDMPHNLGQIV